MINEDAVKKITMPSAAKSVREDKDVLIAVHHVDGDMSIRDIIADCYSSNQNIGGADKWKDLIDATLDNIRMKMPSVDEIENVIKSMLTKSAIYAIDHKTTMQIPHPKEYAEAIHHLMMSKIQ